MPNPFETRTPAVEGNQQIRTPQREAFARIAEFAAQADREAGVVLPVGCGKSGTIALAPFAFRSRRTLLVAPNLHIAHQLHDTFDPAKDDMLYRIRNVLHGGPTPELVEIRGTTANRSDLDASEVVVTNI